MHLRIKEFDLMAGGNERYSRTNVSGSGLPLCQIAKKLLAEKLIDDFYEDYVRGGEQNSITQENLVQQLKVLLPIDQHELLYRWETECVEICGHELRQFADFVAGILVVIIPTQKTMRDTTGKTSALARFCQS